MTTDRHILLAAAETAECEALHGLVAAQRGMAVLRAASVEAVRRMMVVQPSRGGFAAARAPRIDALLLDSGLDIDGGAWLCTDLRHRGCQVPIIVMGASSPEAIVRCLEAGANDCVGRPVRHAELAARLRAQLRQHDVSDDAVLVVGPYLFHPAQRRLQDRASGACIRLTAKETAVLKYLHRAGDVVPRHELLRQIWGYSPDVTSHTVETHMYRLRRKIEPESARRHLVVSESAGYRLDRAWQPSSPSHLAALHHRPAVATPHLRG